MARGYLKLIVFLVFVLVLGCLVQPGTGAAESQHLTILFTHDLHSHLQPYPDINSQGKEEERGGFARLASVIQREKSKNPGGVLVVDAGDFSMGTLFHTLFTREPVELGLMGKMGYDATTFGNHEFDFDSPGLAAALNNSQGKGQTLPQMIASNIGFKPGQETKSGLKIAMDKYPVKDYSIIEKNGIKIGVFGLLGKDATHDLIWGDDIAVKDQIETAKRVVNVLKNKEKVDLIVCISHSGTREVKEDSEDEILAEEVPEIDVIISGHTHTTLSKPIIKGKTIIASAGCYGKYMGIIDLDIRSGEAQLSKYQLEDISPEIPTDQSVASDIQGYKELVSRDFLSQYGLTFDQALAESSYSMKTLEFGRKSDEETGLGDMIADAIKAAVMKTEGENGDYLNLAVAPQGEIRDSLSSGAIKVDDVFRVLSLGMAPDGSASYPLVSCYFYGKEIKNCLETQAVFAAVKPDYNLQLSGVKFRYNPNRIPFDRIYQLEISTPQGYEEIQPDKLYRVSASYMTMVMLSKMGSLSYGIINAEPKDREGNPIKDLKQTVIDVNPNKPGIQELKEWKCLADYLLAQPDKNGNGIPDIPASYSRSAGRYQAIASWNPIYLIKGATYITWGAIGLLVLVLLLIIIVVKLVTMIRRKRKYTFDL
ncbi:MAG: bifunctional metallophosphatase/5'-nucleotidase [Chitinophagales bacterium]